jgi:hypothetical protein
MDYSETHTIKEIVMSKVDTYITLENALANAKTHFETIAAGFALQVFKEENKFYPRTIKA